MRQLHGGGTVILSSDGPMVGAGGASVSGDLLAHHIYDAKAGGAITLSIRKIHRGDGGCRSWRICMTLR